MDRRHIYFSLFSATWGQYQIWFNTNLARCKGLKLTKCYIDGCMKRMTHTYLGVPYYKFLDFNKTLKMDAENISSTSSVFIPVTMVARVKWMPSDSCSDAADFAFLLPLPPLPPFLLPPEFFATSFPWSAALKASEVSLNLAKLAKFILELSLKLVCELFFHTNGPDIVVICCLAEK